MGNTPDFDAFAALLRRGVAIPEMVARLAERLDQALPDQVETTRTGLRRAIRELIIRFDPEEFRVELRGDRALAWVDHVIRGVRVRSEEVGFDDWLERLAAALAEEATQSTAIRLALEAALGS